MMAGMVGILALASILLAYPAMAVQQETSTSSQTQVLSSLARPGDKDRLDLSVGQTITITSVAGRYRAVGDTNETGTATASLTLQVTGAFKHGYALSITVGTITLGNATYTVTGGSAELGPYGRHMVGQGTGDNGAQFLFHGRGVGDLNGNEYAILRVDFSNGSAEYLAQFLVTASIS